MFNRIQELQKKVGKPAGIIVCLVLAFSMLLPLSLHAEVADTVEPTEKAVVLQAPEQDDPVEIIDNSNIEDSYLELHDPTMSFSKAKYEVNVKKKFTLPLTKKYMPESYHINWTSSNKKVASVNNKGQVTGKKVGTVKITASLAGTGLKKTCTVDVVHTKTFHVRATGYCNCASCSGPGHPRTASGRYPRQGRTLAVDRRKIPLGSKIVMKGKTYFAEDVGGAIKGNRIDVYFHSHRRAQSYGVKRVKIKVYYKK